MNFFTEIKVFISAFLKDHRTVGSVVGSSSFLARKMIGESSFNDARSIVELGPGLGGITKEILGAMHPDATLTIVEINPIFCRELKKQFNDARITVLNISANEMSRYISQPVDYLISGIPLANKKSVEQNELLTEIRKILAPTGVYVQFQYSLLSLGNLKKHFPSISLKFTPLNFPPAVIYICHGWKN